MAMKSASLSTTTSNSMTVLVVTLRAGIASAFQPSGRRGKKGLALDEAETAEGQDHFMGTYYCR